MTTLHMAATAPASRERVNESLVFHVLSTGLVSP